MTSNTGAMAAASKGTVLVVLSSSDHVTLEGGKTEPSGFFMNELCIPLTMLLEHGWSVEFANPKGNMAVTDPASMSMLAYLGTSSTKQKHKDLLERMKVESNFASPSMLADLSDSELEKYAGIMIPGGHAPLEDLYEDPDMGRILKHFHNNKKPTGALCHGAIALASTGDPHDHATRFIYASYRMTGYSNTEEMFNEIKWMHKLKIHVETELSKRGGLFHTGMIPLASHIEQDRELITGQNPASSAAFAEAFVKKLDESVMGKRKESLPAVVAVAEPTVMLQAA